MLREHERETAEHFGILDSIEKLRSDLMNIDGVIDVDFDLDGFWSNINQVIVLLRYSLPHATYYKARRALVAGAVATMAEHGLVRSGDPIEDYGEHLYIVTDCPWETKEVAK